MRTVLITGANGFVGKGVLDRLARERFSIRGAVREFVADRAATVDMVSVGDIGPTTDWSEALRGGEVVIHLAGRAHVIHERAADPLTEFRRINALGSQRLALMAAHAGVRRLVYVSSIKVNGEGTTERSFRATDAPQPMDAYAVSKYEAEQSLLNISRQTGLEVVIVRPPLVYGPGVRGNFLNLLEWVDHGVPLPLGSIQNRRSLLGLENFSDFLAVCATHPRAAGETFLISDGEDISTPDLIRGVAHALQKAPRIFRFPPKLLRLAATLSGRAAQCERLCGSLTIDSSKSRQLLQWNPPLTLEQGLQSTGEWYRRGELLSAGRQS